jgi:hypothetical protein
VLGCPGLQDYYARELASHCAIRFNADEWMRRWASTPLGESTTGSSGEFAMGRGSKAPVGRPTVRHRVGSWGLV